MSTLKVDNIRHNTATSDAVVLHNDGTVAITTCTATNLTATNINSTNLINASPLSHRNRIINGAMQIWQRGTSFNSQGNGQNDYTADRWAIGHNNSHMAAVSQQDGTGANPVFRYCARVQRDSGQSQTDQMRFHTALETNDVIPMRGSVITISYYARKGADYSEANSKITGVRIATGENIDGDPNAYSGGHWTNSTTILTGTPTLTTSWQRFTHTTSAVSTSANSMIIEFRHTPVGTAGANDWYEVTGIQLENGSVATPFEFRSYGEELARCERFFQTGRASIGSAYNGFGGNVVHSTYIGFNTKMRAQPSISFGTNHTSNNVSNADYYGGESDSGFSYRVNILANGNYARYSTYFAEAEL